jgi:hypothetical protein
MFNVSCFEICTRGFITLWVVSIYDYINLEAEANAK